MKNIIYLFCSVFLLIISCNNQSTEKTKNISDEASFFLPPPTTYNTIKINDVNLFYREAGDPKKPTIVLLHGYPSSSHSYRNLIPMLASHYHIIAPDNLGSGYSDHPNPETTTYTFDLLADYTNQLLKALKIDNYIMYMQDFGAPVGYRMMLKDPKRIDALIVQNANAYLDGLTPARQAFFKKAQEDTSQEELDFLYNITAEDVIINKQYLFDLDTTNYKIQSPDAWTHDLSFLQSKNDRLIQVQLFQDYYTNLLAYPTWQKMLKETQPKTLITWGAKDEKFNANGAKAYLRDLPNAELHLLDAGHFAVEEKTRDIAELILKFLN
ncbi:alpha/beta hydrolase [Cellulophaga sp. HaHaR_3_176]|uniref:alpha/beta fold hydrolase n=1 Tax=Cellulophaga sp. HaHaR_3_176 TaxID=1942464 RepID=UPI001C1FF8C3|nr:alpha/beta hydrolase [Cellulophaga sp. HaHaR_3_176]QWX85200.1 alpha/beta hydrolase [Cellulophaga sp. HaHaR_3_176]